MNRQEHLIICLIEECAEVIKEASKVQRFSLDEQYALSPFTNKERLQRELKDVFCVLSILVNEGIIDSMLVTAEDVNAKLAKIEHYMEISREHGALT